MEFVAGVLHRIEVAILNPRWISREKSKSLPWTVHELLQEDQNPVQEPDVYIHPLVSRTGVYQ